jgi:hypothetical protein
MVKSLDLPGETTPPRAINSPRRLVRAGTCTTNCEKGRPTSNRAVHTFVGPLFQIREPGKPQRAWKWAYRVVQSAGAPFPFTFVTKGQASTHRTQMLKSNEPSTYHVSSDKLLTGIQETLNQQFEDATFQAQSALVFQLAGTPVEPFKLAGIPAVEPIFATPADLVVKMGQDPEK